VVLGGVENERLKGIHHTKSYSTGRQKYRRADIILSLPQQISSNNHCIAFSCLLNLHAVAVAVVSESNLTNYITTF
jgi:hypothetical protein